MDHLKLPFVQLAQGLVHKLATGLDLMAFAPALPETAAQAMAMASHSGSRGALASLRQLAVMKNARDGETFEVVAQAFGQLAGRALDQTEKALQRERDRSQRLGFTLQTDLHPLSLGLSHTPKTIYNALIWGTFYVTVGSPARPATVALLEKNFDRTFKLCGDHIPQLLSHGEVAQDLRSSLAPRITPGRQELAEEMAALQLRHKGVEGFLAAGFDPLLKSATRALRTLNGQSPFP